ncbi:MAG: hypothetical protein GY950_00220, partial [bacterium]|nr:hypothetical protein [bacterium]
FIFLLGTAAAGFFLVYLPPLVGFRCGPASSLSWNTRKNALFIFCINFVFFILFGFGHSAANHCRHFLSTQGFRHAGTYFTLLSIIFPAFLLSLALEKITGASYKTCFFYVCGVTALLMFGVVLSTLPLFERIYPIVFNSLFSLVFSFIAAAPLILPTSPGNTGEPG